MSDPPHVAVSKSSDAHERVACSFRTYETPILYREEKGSLELYFLRHGKAEDGVGTADRERRLTEEGVHEMQEEARGIAHLGLKFEVIFSSPYPRALETARIVAKELDRSAETMHVVPQLASGRFGLGALQELLASKPPKSALFVGHNPDLSLVIQSLCGGVVEMKKGGLACVETEQVEPDQGVLLFLLTPGQLRRLGRA